MSTRVDPWTRTATLWLRYLTEMNRQTTRLFGVSMDPADSPVDETATPALPSMAHREQEWTVERSVESKGAIGVGDFVRFSKPLSDRDVRNFARASGDTSRLHLESEYASDSRFGERIVHGTLVVGTISAALARLPGLTIYISQDVTYLGPVPVGERVTATCEVVEALGDDRFRLTTVVTDEADAVVVDGEAVVLIDDPPDSQ